MRSSGAIASRLVRRLALALLALCVLGADVALAREKARDREGAPAGAIRVTITVTHLSDREGGIDPRARELSQRLQRQNIRYSSARVLAERRTSIALDRVETLRLPDGRAARFRPVHVGPQGVLIAVDVEGAVKMDARVRKGHMIVIDGGRFEDGKLVISLVPDYD